MIPNGLYLRHDFEALAERHTLVLYDPRHRGRSDRFSEPSQIARGIRNDVDDLEAVRRHFALEALHLIGHSYMGLMVILYAREHPTRVARVVQVGPMDPYPGKPYPAHLTGADAVAGQVFARLGGLRNERDAHEPEEFCRKFWSVLRLLYVVDPANAYRIDDWGRCELPNERNGMKHWNETLLPSILGAIRTFLDGAWPEQAEKVDRLDPETPR